MVAKSIVEPRLAEFDAFFDKFPAIEPGGDHSVRKTLDAPERAAYISGLLVDFSILVAAGTLTQIVSEGMVNKKLGFPSIRPAKQWAIVGVDRGLQIATFALANTVFSDQNIAAQKAVSSAFREEGESSKEADAAGAFAMNWALPSLVGMAGGIVMQSPIYSKEIKRVLEGGLAHHKG